MGPSEGPVAGVTIFYNCFQCLESVSEIESAMVVFRDKFALWGELPRIIHSHVNVDLITQGK